MTTPAEEFGLPWIVASAKTAGTHILLTINASNYSNIGSQRIRLPIGVNTVLLSWTGSKALSAQLRSPENAVYRMEVIPAFTSGSVLRQIIFEVSVPAAGYDLTLSGGEIVDLDLSKKAVAGLRIIPSTL